MELDIKQAADRLRNTIWAERSKLEDDGLPPEAMAVHMIVPPLEFILDLAERLEDEHDAARLIMVAYQYHGMHAILRAVDHKPEITEPLLRGLRSAIKLVEDYLP